jgi:beta-glucosidase/6-phospho-beta-glucosidase/beta-galactosidase
MPPQSDPERVFPEAFLFGVATADHQCEAYEPRWEDVRDVWERRPGLVGRGRATDFWARYPEDVELARRLGCRAFRFSIAWSRVEPRAGEFDDEAFRHYREVVACIRGAGMEPLLTLHHFTWPLHVEARGGMIGDDFPHLFRRYAAEVAARLGREVRYWMTFNEPTQLTYGYVKPWWERDYFVPPGLPQGSSQEAQMLAVGALMRNLFVAHTWARREIKAVNPDTTWYSL